MSITALIADMVRAGVDAQLIGRTAELFAAQSAASARDESAERRRAADRNRKRLRNSAESAESAESPSLEVSEVSPIPPSNLPNPIPKKTPKGVQKRVSDFENELIELGASEQHVADWKRVRHEKKAGPITKSVVDILKREADAANISYAHAVQLCAERCWQNFNREYKFNRPASTADPPKSVFVIEDSPAFDAWCSHLGKRPWVTESRENGYKRGRWFPSEYPPSNERIAS